MIPRLDTMQNIMKAFAEGNKIAQAGVKLGIKRAMNIVVKEARDNVKNSMGARATGAGSSLLHNIGTGEYGVNRMKADSSSVVGTVGTSMEHGIFLEFGTGIYGPKAARITSKTPGKPLAWPVEDGSHFIAGTSASGKNTRHKIRDYKMMFAMSVKGIPPWHWLSDAMKKVSAQFDKIVGAAVQEQLK